MPNRKVCGGVCVLSKGGVSYDRVLDVLVSPKLFERHGCFGMAKGASMHQRRPPRLTHTREKSARAGGLIVVRQLMFRGRETGIREGA